MHALLEESGVAVLGGVADGPVPLPRHHHRQEGRRVQQHRLEERRRNESMEVLLTLDSVSCINKTKTKRLGTSLFIHTVYEWE